MIDYIISDWAKVIVAILLTITIFAGVQSYTGEESQKAKAEKAIEASKEAEIASYLAKVKAEKAKAEKAKAAKAEAEAEPKAKAEAEKAKVPTYRWGQTTTAQLW